MALSLDDEPARKDKAAPQSGWAAAIVGLVFVSGGVLGVFGDRLYTVTTVTKAKNAKLTPEEFRHGYIGFMQKRLTLTEPQVTKLGLIFDETRARMNLVRRQSAGGSERVSATKLSNFEEVRRDFLQYWRGDGNQPRWFSGEPPTSLPDACANGAGSAGYPPPTVLSLRRVWPSRRTDYNRESQT
jgi:hypothetical protein